MIEQVKFIYSPLGKALEKQTKIIENQDKKQIKAIEDHRKQLDESNELIKKDFNINRDSMSHEFDNLEKKLILIFLLIRTKLREEIRKILEIIQIK